MGCYCTCVSFCIYFLEINFVITQVVGMSWCYNVMPVRRSCPCLLCGSVTAVNRPTTVTQHPVMWQSGVTQRPPGCASHETVGINHQRRLSNVDRRFICRCAEISHATSRYEHPATSERRHHVGRRRWNSASHMRTDYVAVGFLSHNARLVGDRK